MAKKLWLACITMSVSGLLLGLFWVLTGNPGNSAREVGDSGLLVALAGLIPLCLVTMHRLRKKAFQKQ